VSDETPVLDAEVDQMAVKQVAPRIARVKHPSLDERLAGAGRPGTARLRRVIPGGTRPRTAPIRSACSRTRTGPGSRIWFRSGTAG
jgi:hypothetical protein